MPLTYMFKLREGSSMTLIRRAINDGWRSPEIILKSLPDDEAAKAIARELLDKAEQPAATVAVKRRNAGVVLGWWKRNAVGQVDWEPWAQ